jgi:hypothetical protein
MPIPKSQLDRILDSIDQFLANNKDRMIADFQNRDTDPVEFLETPGASKMPIAEPANVPQEDAAPTQIHRSKDLFN